MTRFANALGKTGDAAYYSGLATTTRANYNAAWLNASSGVYAPGYPINQARVCVCVGGGGGGGVPGERRAAGTSAGPAVIARVERLRARAASPWMPR